MGELGWHWAYGATHVLVDDEGEALEQLGLRYEHQAGVLGKVLEDQPDFAQVRDVQQVGVVRAELSLLAMRRTVRSVRSRSREIYGRRAAFNS